MKTVGFKQIERSTATGTADRDAEAQTAAAYTTSRAIPIGIAVFETVSWAV